ncbi:MAG: Holliday junction branch migration protein RuvA [Actinomycetota bacterium]
MISSVTGVVAEIGPGAVEVDVHGVGYLVQAPGSTLASLQLGQKVRLLIQMVVREDSLALYGFADMEQRELFRSLNSVTGVGPKLALAVLGQLKPDALRRAVLTSDVAALSAVTGVGKRSAERMILELKSQMGALPAAHCTGASNLAEAREALLGLGYAAGELADVLQQVDEEAEVQQIVKTALRSLSRV